MPYRIIKNITIKPILMFRLVLCDFHLIQIDICIGFPIILGYKLQTKMRLRTQDAKMFDRLVLLSTVICCC